MKTELKVRLLFRFMVVVFIFVGFSYAENVNTLSVIPSQYVGQTNIPSQYTGRYFCPINLSVVSNYGGSVFSNCQYSLKFDPSLASLQYAGRGGGYNETDTVTLSDGLLFVEEKNNSPITGTVVCSELIFKSISANSYTADIKFVNKDGDDPSDHDFNYTDDLLNLAYNGSDTLTGVQNLTISLYSCPCTLDSKAPIVDRRSHNSNAHYMGTQTVSFLIYEDGGTARSYWTSGSKNFDNYGGGAPAGMDNQEGVNSGTIVVSIYSGNVLVSTLTPDSGLTITTYTGDTGIPRYTWDGNDRGYWVSFEIPDLHVEAPVTIVVSGADNALNGGGDCITLEHVVSDTKVLNQAQAPIITFISPRGENINTNTGVVLSVEDSWAGVDTGSLVVEILPVISGGDVIMTGSIYSGTDLNFQLISGSGELGGASKYRVTFQPIYEFAVDSTITLSGYVQDLIGIPAHKEYSFHTRKDCTFYGCVNFVDIFSGNWENINLIQGNFTGSLIVITGTILPYPLLTGENSEIVMCAPIDASINLTGNVDIYSGDEKINGNKYMYEDLYVTGLDFEYQDGVIIPRY